MNDIKEQFLGFYYTKPLFEKLEGINQFEFEEIDLDSLDFDIEIEDKLPLGKRVEHFFEYYINHTSRYKLLYKNIQVRENKETLGELDFILFDNKLNKYLHTEFVCKYYLYDESFENEIDRFIGPNRDDTLFKKLNKIKNSQLPLLFENKTKELIDIDFKNVYQNSSFKANIFLPYNSKIKELPSINNDCIKGYYVKFELFKSDENFRKHQYFLPQRYDWIRNINQDEKWLTYDDILIKLEYITNFKKSPLLWIKKENTYEEMFITWW